MRRSVGSQQSTSGSRSVASARSHHSQQSNNSSRRGDAGMPRRIGGESTTLTSFATSNIPNGGNNDAPPMEPAVVCMTVVENGPRIAFACYHEDWNEIILEDIPASGYDCEDVAKRFLQSVRPNIMLLSNRIISNEPLLDILTHLPPSPFVLGGDNDNDEDRQSNANSRNGSGNEHGNENENENGRSIPLANKGTLIPYRLLKSGAFDARVCQEIILQKLRVMSLLRGHTNHVQNIAADVSSRSFHSSRYHSIASVVDFDSTVQVQALGSLLSYLHTTIFSQEDGGTITVNNVVQARTSMYMNISSSTFASLHIFSTEHHPLMASQGGHAKEGWSLYSLLDRTQSKGGSQVLKEWMQKPLLDIGKIRERQDAVEVCMDVRFQTPIGTIIQMLNKVGPVTNILTRIQKCNTKPLDFVILGRSLSAALTVYQILRHDIVAHLRSLQSETGFNEDQQQNQRRDTQNLLEQIVYRCDAPSMTRLQQLIVSVVDEESTMECKTTVVVRPGYSPKLDRLRDEYDTLDETLANAGRMIRAKYSGLLTSSVIFLPQVGFLTTLAASAVFDANGNQVIVLPDDFVHIFNNEGQSLFKNETMVQLDNDIGDLDGFIKDTERTIVAELEDQILDVENELRESFRALSELDCIISFADCAANMNFVRPQVIEASQQRILIKNGRHPLQEAINESEYVPNDTLIDDNARINIVTGPNYSGKSCYTRQVGVLVYMAHIGCFIPCDRAVISLTDNIIARISNTETCAVPQSSFQLDLTQMASVLRQSSPNTLVLIDEFGKGTSPASGVAMLAAALMKLSELKSRVVCTTHFLELFTMNLIRDGENGMKALQMAYVLPASNDDDTATPLFKLTQGVASTSAGLICARLAGLNPSIVSRAREINHAVREGRTVEPQSGALLEIPTIPEPRKTMLRQFLIESDWESASEECLKELIRGIARSTSE